MRFIESIQFKDGEYLNLPLHQARIDSVFKKYNVETYSHNLNQILPDLKMDGIFKVRMVYDMDSEDAAYDLEFAEYHQRKIQTLEIVHTELFDYSVKYESRDKINDLVELASADDIIIAIDNHITDGSYFNLAFWDGINWVTPDTPLLNGVRRTQLLNEGKIQEQEITTEDISSFQKVSLINAMLDLGQLELPISHINF